MARRKREVRPNFNAGGWADSIDIILGVAFLVGAFVFALTRN